MRGYSSAANVSALLGRTFTAAQVTQATYLLDYVETYITRETLQTWMDTAITAERYDVRADVVYLLKRPVSSIQLVQWRTTGVGDTLQTLTAGTNYELFDVNRGELHLEAGFAGNRAVLFVSYTPNNPVPADISHAADLICAKSMGLQLFPDRLGITDAQLDTHVKMTYAAITLDVPLAAAEILRDYRASRLLFA